MPLGGRCQAFDIIANMELSEDVVVWEMKREKYPTEKMTKENWKVYVIFVVIRIYFGSHS